MKRKVEFLNFKNPIRLIEALERHCKKYKKKKIMVSYRESENSTVLIIFFDFFNKNIYYNINSKFIKPFYDNPFYRQRIQRSFFMMTRFIRRLNSLRIK